jgi:outer membrane protein insertion porin family
MAYNPAVVDKSIRALYQSGYFEFVEVSVQNTDSGTIDVTFEIVSKYTIETVRFEGADEFSRRRLLNKSEFEPEKSLDEYAVSVAAEKIKEYYIEKGYPNVEVDYSIERDGDSGTADVIFQIEEGNKIKIKLVEFDGNEVLSDRKLRKQLETKKNNFFLSWVTGTGKFDKVQFEEDLETLRTYYRNEGYLDVVVDESKVNIEIINSKKMIITINVVEGLRYFVGDMEVDNATIFTESELLSVIQTETGDPFSPEKVDEAGDAVRTYYTSRGYLNAFVRAERVPNMESRQIDLIFRVRESEKFYVESINVEGNTKTKSRVIIRELALRPGDVFDLQRMETSKSRLENTRYFETVALDPETTNLPGRKDLGVNVREGRTGNLTFGAGFGSIERAVVYIEVTQSNFDIFNWRSGFQGDGQKFRFKASLGSRSNEILISFEEPWLFEQRLAFGIDLFRTESEFNSTNYNELRTGFELFLRRRLFELVEARLSYRLELVEIFDVAFGPGPRNPDGSVTGDGVPDVFQAAQGEDLISKVGLTFLRDNRDSLIFTRKGSRTTLTTELAGVGGDVNYFKLEGRTAQFFPTFDTLRQTFSVLGRLGSIAPYGDSTTVPFYDRFYLGGPDTLRGFEFRDVGPRDTEVGVTDSVGGNSYALVSFEYQFRLAEPIGLVVFYDWGFVNAGEYDFSFSDYADNWGVGARVMLLGSPLKLDFGIPITSPAGVDGGVQFNFSFGTRF